MGGRWTAGLRAACAACALGLALPAREPAAEAAQETGQEAAQQPPATPQDRPFVTGVRVAGNVRYSEAQLVAAFGQAPGAPLLAQTELKRGVQVLFDTFRVRTTVELVPSAAGPGEVELLLRVEELPLDLELRITGNIEIDDDKVHEWAGVGEREGLYLHQAPRVRARLLARYREEGFYFVDVKVVERPAGTDPETGAPVAPDVIFEIVEGPEVKVRDVVLQGNELLPNKGFLMFKRGLSKLARAELRPPRFFGFFAKDFVEETLQADIVAMREVYRDLGYLDAVVELERLEFSEDREWVTIHLAVDAGEPYLVESVELAGFRRVRDEQAERGFREEPAELSVPQSELEPLLKLRAGEVFLRRRVEEDHRALRQFYGEKGHVEHPSLAEWEGFHFEEPELLFDGQRPVVRVVYRIVEGEPVRLGEILVRGNLHTQDRVVRRMITVEPGQVADPTAVERSRSRIEATGFFSPDQFRPDIIPPQVRYLPTDDPGVKDLEFRVDEGGVLSFNIGGAISTTNGLSGTLAIRKGNFDLTNLPGSLGSTFGEVGRLEAFHGAGQTLNFSAQPGTEVSQYAITFFEPDIFDLHEDYIGLGVTALSRRRFYDSHREERRDYGLNLRRQLSPDSSALVAYSIGSVDVSDLDEGGEPGLTTPLTVPADLKAQEGTNDLAHFDVGYNFSTVDNRLTPRNGLDFGARAALYDQALGSDFDFARTTFQFDFYDEFDEDPEVVSDYVHLALNLTLNAAYGATDEVPYTERVFAGGNNLRGFDFRGVGPNENGYAIGGVTALLGTLEYRRPLVKNVQPGSYRELEVLQGGVFLDWGILDPDEFSLDTDELRASTGFLFGISLGAFPITFSFGFPLREGDGDETQVFEFEFGF
ncbi:MAG TPA: BamA/TamA family outer membrane protein [Planctomycetota bacterium]